MFFTTLKHETLKQELFYNIKFIELLTMVASTRRQREGDRHMRPGDDDSPIAAAAGRGRGQGGRGRGG